MWTSAPPCASPQQGAPADLQGAAPLISCDEGCRGALAEGSVCCVSGCLVCSSSLWHLRSCPELGVGSAAIRVQYAASRDGSRVELGDSRHANPAHPLQLPCRGSGACAAPSRSHSNEGHSSHLYFYSASFICITVAPNGPKWDQGSSGWRLCSHCKARLNPGASNLISWRFFVWWRVWLVPVSSPIFSHMLHVSLASLLLNRDSPHNSKVWKQLSFEMEVCLLMPHTTNMFFWALLERQIVTDCLSLKTVQLSLWRHEHLGWMPSYRMEIQNKTTLFGIEIGE